MPYGGTTTDEDVKIEHCVASVMSKRGVDKVSAIKICKAQILKARHKARRKKADG